MNKHTLSWIILASLNGVLAAVLLICGWLARALGMFTNALFLMFLVLSPVRVLLAVWRIFRKTWVNLFSKAGRASAPLKLWVQVVNGCLFYLLALSVMEIRVLPFQFTTEEYRGVRLTFGWPESAWRYCSLFPARGCTSLSILPWPSGRGS